MQAVSRGGWFASSSCSSALDQTVSDFLCVPNCPQIEEQMFERVLAQAASQNGRDLQIVQMCGAGPDHPVVPGFEKTKYLKFALCRLL